MRWCIDYRKVNEITEKDPVPLPNVEGLDTLADATMFSTLIFKVSTKHISTGDGIYIPRNTKGSSSDLKDVKLKFLQYFAI